MYTVTTTYERATPATPYYIDTDSVLKTEFSEFLAIHSPLLESFTVDNVSPTVQVSVATYASEAVYQDFMGFFDEAFPTFFVDRDAYCAANNITVDRSVQDA